MSRIVTIVVGIATIVVFFPTIVVGAATIVVGVGTIVVDCDNCEHCDNYELCIFVTLLQLKSGVKKCFNTPLQIYGAVFVSAISQDFISKTKHKCIIMLRQFIKCLGLSVVAAFNQETITNKNTHKILTLR